MLIINEKYFNKHLTYPADKFVNFINILFNLNTEYSR